MVWASDATSTGVGDDPDDRGADGDPLTPPSLLGAPGGAERTGLYALDDADLFCLLVLAPDLPGADVNPVVVSAAHAYCQKRRAMLLLDAPTSWTTASEVALPDAGTVGAIGANAALYFPRIRAANPLHGDMVEQFPAAGAVAGVLARTDAQRGVDSPGGPGRDPAGSVRSWRDPDLRGDRHAHPDGGQLPAPGPGSRPGCVGGADRSRPRRDRITVEVPVRAANRAVHRGERGPIDPVGGLRTERRAAVGRPSAPRWPPSWTLLFRAGAFQGVTAKDAYFVRCDRSTTTQADIDRGVVNMVIGFAALKPAEFVIIQIQQTSAPRG